MKNEEVRLLGEVELLAAAPQPAPLDERQHMSSSQFRLRTVYFSVNDYAKNRAICPRSQDEKQVLTFCVDYGLRRADLGHRPGLLPPLSGRDIAELEYGIPSVAEQKAIATVLSDVDAEIAALEQRRDKTRLLKQAMMQELLTGKTRLL